MPSTTTRSRFLDEWAGLLRPEFAVMAAARAALARGARVETHTRVVALEPDDDGVTVVTADERRFRVRQVVVTTGPWTGSWAPDLAAHVAAQKLVLTWYRPDGDLAAYAADRFPIFIRDTEGPQVYGIPTLDGGSVKVAPHASYGEVEDADDLDRNVAADDLEPINAAVERYLPGLVPTPVRVAAYMDAYTTDGHAMVGRMPGRAAHLAARGLLRPRVQDGPELRSGGRRARAAPEDRAPDRAPRPGAVPRLDLRLPRDPLAR